jgi:hypothetical protein
LCAALGPERKYHFAIVIMLVAKLAAAYDRHCGRSWR